MRRVIFVDDEPRVLDGLRRQLRPLRREWDMTFAAGGVEALEIMEDVRFDVLVSDMRMPQMDGATLLARCRERHPGTARIVLSGHMEIDRALHAIRSAHQFLTKPCDANALRAVLQRMAALDSLVDSSVLRARLGGIDGVPLDSSTDFELSDVLQDPAVPLDRIIDLVSSHPMLTARVLQLVNSAFVGMHESIVEPGDAVRAMGPNLLRELVLSIGITYPVNTACVATSFDVGAHLRHASAVSRLARSIAGPGARGSLAATAGRLHDLGEMLLAVYLPAAFEDIRQDARSGQIDVATAETARLGSSHAQIGAYLLSLWGLPSAIVDALMHHHVTRDPASDDDVGFVVHVADALVVEAEGVEDAPARGPELDEDVAVRAFGAERMARWREEAAAIVESEANRVGTPV